MGTEQSRARGRSNGGPTRRSRGASSEDGLPAVPPHTPSPLHSATPLRCVIDGKLQPPAMSLGDWVRDCNTGNPVHEMVAASTEQVEEALAAAERVHRQGVWANLSLEDKCAWLNKLADAMVTYEAQMGRADARETGVVCELTTIINSSIKGAFQSVADGIRKANLSKEFGGVHGPIQVSHKPWGPALIIAPWNVPGGSVVPKIAAALAAGCPVILKPSEWAPTALDLLGRAIVDAQLPPGVFQLLHGAGGVGERLVRDPRIRCVNFTGSAGVGTRPVCWLDIAVV